VQPPAGEEALRRAEERSWTVVSVKNDWATVFPKPLLHAFAANRNTPINVKN
jgi:hypothetical protein